MHASVIGAHALPSGHTQASVSPRSVESLPPDDVVEVPKLVETVSEVVVVAVVRPPEPAEG